MNAACACAPQISRPALSHVSELASPSRARRFPAFPRRAAASPVACTPESQPSFSGRHSLSLRNRQVKTHLGRCFPVAGHLGAARFLCLVRSILSVSSGGRRGHAQIPRRRATALFLFFHVYRFWVWVWLGFGDFGGRRRASWV